MREKSINVGAILFGIFCLLIVSICIALYLGATEERQKSKPIEGQATVKEMADYLKKLNTQIGKRDIETPEGQKALRQTASMIEGLRLNKKTRDTFVVALKEVISRIEEIEAPSRPYEKASGLERSDIRTRLNRAKGDRHAEARIAKKLGTARPELGDVGAAMLDFSGTWRADMRLEASMAGGGLTIKLPRGLGVSMTADNFLALLDPQGFVERDGEYTSQDYGEAERHLDISLKASLGQVKIEWID